MPAQPSLPPPQPYPAGGGGRTKSAVCPLEPHISLMQTFFMIAIGIALLAVLGTLGMGIIQMAKGGDPHRSNRLMQQRVILQGIAIALFAILLFLVKP
jgi:hypothetical protein